VPGGGAALLACRPALLARQRQAIDPDERAAYGILARALEEPFRTLVSNAGCSPGQVLALLEKLPPGYGFDLRVGKTADMQATGLVDAAGVLREAVRSAVSSAALLLTTDVLVHLKDPPQSYTT
jgi:chaperonin GroEL